VKYITSPRKRSCCTKQESAFALATAVDAVSHWFRSRGQPFPSHAERRLARVDEMVSLYDQDLAINDIAAKVGMCSGSVTLLLRERLQQLGRAMIDGRSRRGKRAKSSNGQASHSTDQQTPSDVPDQSNDEEPPQGSAQQVA
jgi:hypothetical protein